MSILETKYLQWLFFPLSLLYRLIVFLRNRLYDWGWLHSYKLSCSVISIGNLTVGGTGKTPAVEFTAHYFLKKGKRVAILSRGYKRQSRGTVIVSNGETLLTDVKIAGDEPYLLARKLKGVPVIVDENRYRGGLVAQNQFGAEIIILDDGFQHRKLARDLDIVLVDASSWNKNHHLLPAGPYREPRTNLKRAHIVWLTRVTQCNNLIKIIEAIWKYYKGPLILTTHIPGNLYQIPSGRAVGVGEITGKKVLAFSGIAKPESFRATLQSLGISSLEMITFSDHHIFTLQDLEKIRKRIQKTNAEVVVTTEKDFIRLPQEIPWDCPFFYLEIKMEVLQGQDVINSTMQKFSKAKATASE